jgi:hypothetical protein
MQTDTSSLFCVHYMCTLQRTHKSFLLGNASQRLECGQILLLETFVETF